jgi:hypothetical protein
MIMTEPNKRSGTVGEDDVHDADFLAALRRIMLIDAYGIQPEKMISMLFTESLKHSFGARNYCYCEALNAYGVRESWIAPDVVDALVRVYRICVR